MVNGGFRPPIPPPLHIVLSSVDGCSGGGVRGEWAVGLDSIFCREKGGRGDSRFYFIYVDIGWRWREGRGGGKLFWIIIVTISYFLRYI